jgi:hypothetical protein
MWRALAVTSGVDVVFGHVGVLDVVAVGVGVGVGYQRFARSSDP